MLTLKFDSRSKSSRCGAVAGSAGSNACFRDSKKTETAGLKRLDQSRSNGLEQVARCYYIQRKLPRNCGEKLFDFVEIQGSDDLITKDFVKLLQLYNTSGNVAIVKIPYRHHPAIMIPENHRTKKLLKCGSDCAVGNEKYLKGFIKQGLPKKTVHFLPRSHCQLFPIEKPIACPQRSESNVEQYFSRYSACPALYNCNQNPIKSQQFVNLKNLKVSPRKKQGSTKRERLLLREFRLQKWATISEDNRNVTKSLEDFPKDIETSLQGDGAIVTSVKSTTVKSMQDRALSNVSKIQNALNIKNSTPTQKQIDHYFEALGKSADSGVWCDLTLEKGEKAKTLTNSNENASNQTHVSKQKSQNEESFYNEVYSKSYQTTPADQGHERSNRPPIVGCTWWQDSACINFLTNDTNQQAVDGRHSFKIISPQNEYHRLHNDHNSCVCMSPANTEGGIKSRGKSIEETHFSREKTDTEVYNRKALDNIIPKCQPESLVSKKTCFPSKTLQRYNSRGSCSTSSVKKERLQRSHHCYKTVNYSASKRSRVRNKRRSLGNDSSDDDSPLQDCHRPTRALETQSPLSFSKNRFAHWLGPELETKRYTSFKTAKCFCSSCSNASVRSTKYVFLEEPLKVSTPVLSFGKPGLLAFRSGTDKAILFRCSCEDCTKLRHHARLRRNEQLHKCRRCNAAALRQRSYKHKKNYKEKKRASTKSRSNISTHSRKTSGMWSFCFRCFDEGSSSSFSGGSDSGNDDDDNGGEGGDFFQCD